MASHKYSEVVKVLKGNLKNKISVFPNPVIGNNINLRVINQPSGEYYMRLLNTNGEVIMVTKIRHLQSNTLEVIKIEKLVSQGMYQLEITKPNATQVNLNVLF